MTSSACSGSVEAALAAAPGVRHAAVSLTLGECQVEYDAAETDEVRWRVRLLVKACRVGWRAPCSRAAQQAPCAAARPLLPGRLPRPPPLLPAA